MRRIVALIALALIGSPLAGYALGNPALVVGNQSVSSAQLTHEVDLLRSVDAPLGCYVGALWNVSLANGAGANTLQLSGVTAWANIRLEGLALEKYAAQRFNFAITPQIKSNAIVALSHQMESAAQSAAITCPTSAANALNIADVNLVDAMVSAQAAGAKILAEVPNSIGTDTASLKAFYNAHLSEYDNICVRVAVVPAESVGDFTNDVRMGASPDAVARKYSVDASAANGGSYGCYGPNTQARDLTRGVAIGQWGSPQQTSQNGVSEYLYVSPMSRTHLPFSSVESVVLADVRQINVGASSAIKTGIYEQIGVRVNPTLGRFGISSGTAGIYAPLSPQSSLVTNEGASLGN